MFLKFGRIWYKIRGLTVPLPLRFVFRHCKYNEKFRYTNIYTQNLLLFATRFVGFDDAAFRGADEFEERIALGTLRNLLFDLVATVQVVQAALEEDAAGVVDLGDAFVRKAAARKPDLVDARETERVVAHDDVGREVLPQQRAALHHGVRPDVGPLVDGGVAADDHPVADVHFAGERHAVGDHAVAADDAVVPDVDVAPLKKVGMTIKAVITTRMSTPSVMNTFFIVSIF